MYLCVNMDVHVHVRTCIYVHVTMMYNVYYNIMCLRSVYMYVHVRTYVCYGRESIMLCN